MSEQEPLPCPFARDMVEKTARQMVKENTKLKEENGRLHFELNEAKMKLYIGKEQFDKLKKECDRLAEENDSHREAVSKQASIIKERNNEITNLQRKNELLLKTIGEMREEMSGQDEYIAELKEELATAKLHLNPAIPEPVNNTTTFEHKPLPVMNFNANVLRGIEGGVQKLARLIELAEYIYQTLENIEGYIKHNASHGLAADMNSVLNRLDKLVKIGYSIADKPPS